MEETNRKPKNKMADPSRDKAITPINVNGINAPLKRQRLLKMDLKTNIN